jgi:hypothetical protein
MTTFLTTFLSPTSYKLKFYEFFMENYSIDIGEEIISKLKELNLILEKLVQKKNEKEL